MKIHRIHNFNPGPAALPLSVLEEMGNALLDRMRKKIEELYHEVIKQQ